jgi:plasmid maintenance system killer protein
MWKEINKIIETNKVKNYLITRKLLSQYKNKKENILNSVFTWNYLKIREPKKDEIWYFRINKQFRALWFLDWDTLKIFDIDNHQ